MANNEEKREVYYITKNFDTAKKIGDMVDIHGAIEGAIVFIPCFKIIGMLPLEGTYKISVYVIVFVSCLMIGIIGINGEHLSEFAWAVFKHLQRKRVTFYNPRAKLEAAPNYMVENERKLLPRDRIMQLIGRSPQENEKYMDSMREEDYNIDYRDIYFEDDDGIVEKPDALKTRKEIREERQAEAKQRKEQQRRQKEKKAELKQRRKELEKKKKAAKKAGIKIEDYEAAEALPEKEDADAAELLDPVSAPEEILPSKPDTEMPDPELSIKEPVMETDTEEVVVLEEKEPEPPVVDLFENSDSAESAVETNDSKESEEEVVELFSDEEEEEEILDLFPQEELVELKDSSNPE